MKDEIVIKMTNTNSLNANRENLQLKLREIAKHIQALVNELDAIDNAWQCDDCDKRLDDELDNIDNQDKRGSIHGLTIQSNVINYTECKELSAKQIGLIRGMLNRNEKGMAICSCDIKRAINIDDASLPTRLEGSS